MKKLKTAIIGCGGIANGKHLPNLAQLPDIGITALCDIIPGRAEAARAKFAPDAKVYTDYKLLIAENPDLDNIHVCTPNDMHSEISVAALNAGINVMCEKPMAINYAEALKMKDAAEKSGKLLTIGYQHRFDPDVTYMRRAAGNGEFGDIYFAKARVLRRRGVPTWGVFTRKARQGGGCFMDIGTHALDTLLYIMDNYEPAYVTATTYQKFRDRTDCGNPFGNWNPEEYDVEDSGFAFVVMKNGATIILETAFALNTSEEGGVQYSVSGTKAGADNLSGKLRLNGDKYGSLYLTEPNLGAGGVAFFSGKSVSPALAEQICFEKALKGEGKLMTTPEQAIVTSRILDGAYKSAESGKTFYFDTEEVI